MGNRRAFVQQTLITLGLVAVSGPLKSIARAASPRWAPTLLRVSTPALRARWPQVLRVTLTVARANAARGIVGAGALAIATLRALRRTTGHAWYDPTFRPSLRSLITGHVR